MSNANPLQLLRSNTANKRPDPTALADGRPAVNTNAVSPGLFFKDSAGNLVKVGPVHVGTTAPNASPASGGATGNSLGEQWLDTSGGVYVLKIWDGSAWRSETGTFVDASGDTMTGALVMDNQQQVRFREVTANGTNYIALQAPASVASDKTITLPDVNGTVVTTGDTGTVTSTMIADATIVDADISASAEIAVSKLADGTARQLLQTDAAGAGVEWTSNVDVPGTLDVTGAATFDSTVAVTGALTKSGSNVVTVGDTGTVTSTMILDGTIVNADVNASAAIAGTKISPDFGSQNVTTTGISTSASFIPTSSVVPTNGVYLPAANSVAISTNGTGRLFVNSNGDVSVGTTSTSGFGRGISVNGTTYSYCDLYADGSIYGRVRASTNEMALLAQGTSSYLVFGQNNTERMRLTSTGLGLGTSDPGSLGGILAVQKSQAADTAIVVDNSGTSGASTSSSFIVADGGATRGWFRRYRDGTGNTAIGFTDALLFEGNISGTKATRMVIDSSGRVGVGTASPVFGVGDGLEVARYGVATIRVSSNTQGVELRSDAGTGTLETRGGSPLLLGTSSTERARIDSSGRLLVGTSSARENYFGAASGEACQLEVEGNDYKTSGASFTSTNNAIAGWGPHIALGRSRGGSVGTNGLVSSGDGTGTIIFHGNDGSSFIQSARIDAFVDGTPGANDMPGRLVFSVTRDGQASPTEALRISNQGVAQITAVDTNSASLVVSANAASGSQYGVLVASANDQNATGTYFFRGVGGATERFTVRTDGGIANYSANNVNLSDRNAKKDITPATGTWDCIKEWEIVNYRYKNQPDAADLNLGVIAQQVAESCPEVITVFEEAKDSQPEKLGVKEQQMYWMAIKALQEAQMRIETLEAKVAALESA